jgi:hypothetical protein
MKQLALGSGDVLYKSDINVACDNGDKFSRKYLSVQTTFRRLMLRSGYMDSGRNIIHDHRFKVSCMWLNMTFYINSRRWFLSYLVCITCVTNGVRRQELDLLIGFNRARLHLRTETEFSFRNAD